MSRYTRTTNPHDLFEDNVHEANGLRDKKAIERQQLLSEERASIDALNREIAEEERIRNAKKAALRNEQYRSTPTTSNKNTKTLTITKEEKTAVKSQLKSEAKIAKSPVKPTTKSAMA